jgi:predicted ABC-type ATPase
MTEDEIRNEGIIYAKRNKMRIARELTNPTKFHPEGEPISVFMAGSPGAGKTEFSKSLINIIEEARHCNVVRIDTDEVRAQLPGYVGGNAYLFQGAASLIVEKVHDLVLKQKQTFIFDGTFAKYEKAVQNIERSLGVGRRVFVFYLYQAPEIAWRFTKAREATEGRNIPREAFIEQFIGARNAVEGVRNKFGEGVVVFLVRKNFEKNTVDRVIEVAQGNSFDDFLDEHYNENQLKQLI